MILDKTIPHPFHLSKVVRTHVLDIPVDCVVPDELEQALDELADAAQEGKPAQIIFLRTRDIFRARRDRSFRSALMDAGLILPVSKEITRALRQFRRPVPHRFFPTDTMVRILGWLEGRQGGLYLLGAKGLEITTVEQRLRQTFPGCRIVGRYMGFFSRSNEQRVCMAIKKSNPVLLLAGPGLVGTNKWLHRRKACLNLGLSVWTDDFFSYILGKSRRVNKVSFRRGREFLGGVNLAPWKMLEVFTLMGFRLRVLLQRTFGRRRRRVES